MIPSLYHEVLDELTRRRARRQQQLQELNREVNARYPAVRDLSRTLRRAAVAGDKPAVEAAQEKLTTAQEKALAEMGYAPDALRDTPGCPLCRDTGYADGQLCACVRNEAARRMLGGCALPDFSCFSADFYSQTPVQPGITQRDYMARLRELMQTYCAQFPDNQRGNVLFTGKAGLGKTYLMDCMGSELIHRGFSVIRITAYQLNEWMLKAMRGESSLDTLLSCDALLLDDMGSEPLLNKVTITGFFNVFNERLLAGRAFVVTTNLTPAEIQERYGDRVFSRLLDQRMTSVIPFLGADVRRKHE